MSYSPNAFGSFCPTSCVFVPLFWLCQAISSRFPYRLAGLPPRAAYSHSASVGSRIPTAWQYACASFQSTVSTGKLRAPKLARVLSRHAFVGCLRHLRLPHPEPLRDCDLMRGFFIAIALCVAGRAPHHERPWWDPDVLQAVFRIHPRGRSRPEEPHAERDNPDRRGCAPDNTPVVARPAAPRYSLRSSMGAGRSFRSARRSLSNCS